MGDQCETFSLEPVYLNTLEMAFLELVLVCSPSRWWMYLFPRSAGRACYKPGACPWFPSAEGAPQQVLPHPQAEAPLEDLLAPPQTLESLVTVLASPPPEEPRGDCACSPSDGGADGGAAGRPACSSSASEVAGARASLLSAGGAPSKCFLTFRRRRRWKTCLLLLRR